MKKLIYIIVALLVLTGCLKKDDAPEWQEVVFSGIQSSVDDAKSTATDCDNPTANYAKIVIDEVIYRPAVFYLEGIPYTQSIKLSPGEHPVSEFILMFDNNTPGNYADDKIVFAVPEAGSDYAVFVNHPTTFNITVSAFAKTEVPVEVLCFEDVEYLSFGFNWFALTEIIVREQIFFGDICVPNPESYAGSLYEQQENGLSIDMPAIFRIDVYKNDAFIVSYSNESWLGEGIPLEVNYPDNLNAADHFEFELWIYVKEGNQFVYKYYHTWEFNDDQKLSTGPDPIEEYNDGVVDFVLGGCVYDYIDLELDFPDNPEITCETAFAYSESTGICFYDIQQIEADRWGWTNGTLGTGEYILELWAGAGQCDIQVGRQVGILTVEYDGSTAVVTYTMSGEFTLNSVHLYVGNDILPKKNNKYTLAPGQYPIKGEDMNGATTVTYTVENLTGDIYVVAHADVCGPF